MNEWMRAAARELSARAVMTFAMGAQVALDGAQIVDFTVREGADSALLPGSVLSAEYALTLINDDRQWCEGGSLRGNRPLKQATVQIWIESAAHSQASGVFTVKQVEAQERGGVIVLRGSDSIAQEFSGAFSDSLAYPATLQSVWEHLVAQTRYVWSGTVPNGGAIIDARPEWKDASLRRAAGWIAQAAGCLVRLNRAGALELVSCRPADAAQSLTMDDCLSMTDGMDVFGPVAALSVLPDGAEAEVTASDGVGETVSIRENPLYQAGAAHLNALIQGTLSQMKGLTLRRMDFVWRGDPALSIGDGVSVKDSADRALFGVVTRQTMQFERGFQASCSCETPDLGDNGLMRAITPEGGVNADALVGTVDGGLLAVGSVTARSIAAGSIAAEKIAAGAVSADKIAAGSVTADKIAASAVESEKIKASAVTANKISASAVTSEKIKAGAVKADHIDAGSVTAEKIQAGSITADRLKAYIITADSGLIANGAIGTAQIADGSITSAKVVSLSADVITAGTLSAERLVIVGEDGVIYRINASSAGLSASELSKDQYKNYLNGTVIVANSITAAQIAAKTITGNEIAANAIKAANIDVVELFASEATIAQINAMDISGNQYLKLAVSKAESAQSTADTAKANAATAQSTANTAKSKADANESDITALTTRVSQAEVKITPTAIAATVREEIEFGGRNFAADTNQGVTNWVWSMEHGDKTITEVVENGVRCCKLQRGSAEQSGWSIIRYEGLLRDALEPGTQYTLTVDIKASVSTTLGFLALATSSSTNNMVAGATAIANTLTANQWVRCEWRFTTLASFSSITIGEQSINFSMHNSQPGVSYTFRNLKLEKGSVATDWSPAPEDAAGAVHVDSSYSKVEINKDRVRIVSTQMEVAVPSEDGEDDVMRVDADGVHAEVVEADTVLSDSVVSTQGDASYTPADAGALAEILEELSGKYLLGVLSIDCKNVSSGSFEVQNVHGPGRIRLLNGTMNGLKIANCDCYVYCYSATFSTAETGAVVDNSERVYFSTCTFNAGVGIQLGSVWRARARMHACTGTCTVLAKLTLCSELDLSGSKPTGTLNLEKGSQVYNATSDPNFTAPSSGSVPTTQVATVSLSPTSTSTSGHSGLGSKLYQGRYSSSQSFRKGVMLFTLPSDLTSAANIESATLTIKRIAGVGGGGSVVAQIRCYDQTGTLYASKSVKNGQTVSIDVTSAVKAMKTSGYTGLMLYNPATSTVGDKTYTTGYARFAGKGESGAPVLKVTYKK